MPEPHPHHLVFVCGLHRSGTSVLHRSLRDHPDISGFHDTPSPEDEGMHLQTVYPPSGRYGGAGAFGFHPEAHLTESSPLVTEANREQLFREWSPYWDLSRTYLLEKSPPNLIRTRFLQAMFPESSFVVVLRHPLAVSYATKAWYRRYRVDWRRLPGILEHWLVCHELFRADRPNLERSCVLKYEEFVAAPQDTVDRVYGFLGVPSRPVEQEVTTAINERYFARWRHDASRWPSRMTTARLVDRYEERVRSFGYSLVDLDWVGPAEL